MTYQLTSGDTILRVSDGVFIPQALGNADYEAYQLWLNAGNTPAPSDSSAQPPEPDYVYRSPGAGEAASGSKG